MSRGGSKSTKQQTRRCIATHVELPKVELIRFVLGADDQVTPDIAQKLPGRGLWVAADKSALCHAIEKNAFSRAAKRKAIIPKDLVALVEKLLITQVINLIALARKSGYALQGYETVKSALIQDKVRLLLQASDGSMRQIDKLRPPTGGAHITTLSQSELGLAFGRDYVIHAALTGGGLVKRIQSETSRLAGLRFSSKSC